MQCEICSKNYEKRSEKLHEAAKKTLAETRGPHQAPSSQVRRPQRFSSTNNSFDTLDRIHKSLSNKGPHYELTTEEAKGYIERCKATLLDMKRAPTQELYENYRQALVKLYHEGEQLGAYQTENNFKDLVDHFRELLENEKFFTKNAPSS